MTKSQISLEMKIILNEIRLTALELNQAIYNLSETLKNSPDFNSKPDTTDLYTTQYYQEEIPVKEPEWVKQHLDNRFMAATDTEYVIGLN